MQNQRIVFVTGKGGVGKSSVAAAMALKFAKEGLKTLLVELGDQSDYEIFLKKPGVSYQPISLEKNLDLALWSSQECLKEYALHLLKVESLYRLFFENKISRTLINIAPALPELAMLGKITSGPRRHGPSSPYEVLVVDAPSTGHFLSLLRAPKGMAEAVSFGPMGEQSRSIFKTLLDEKICQYYVVTLPEEFPMQESAELMGSLEKEFGLHPKLILNRVLRTSLKSQDLDSKAEDFSKYFRIILNKQEQMQEKAKTLSLSQELPWSFKTEAWDYLNELCENLRPL